jgi:hypothetical protein
MAHEIEKKQLFTFLFIIFSILSLTFAFLLLKPQIDYKESFIEGRCKSLSLFTKSTYCCEVDNCWCDYCSSMYFCSFVENLPKHNGSECCSSSTCCKQKGNRGRCRESIIETCSYKCGDCYYTNVNYFFNDLLNNMNVTLKCSVNDILCKYNNEQKYAQNNTWECWYNTQDNSLVFENNYKVDSDVIFIVTLFSVGAFCFLFLLIFFKQLNKCNFF